MTNPIVIAISRLLFICIFRDRNTSEHLYSKAANNRVLNSMRESF